MALKANPLTPLMHEFFDQMTELSLVSWIEQGISTSSVERIEANIQELREHGYDPGIGYGTCLDVPVFHSGSERDAFTRGIGKVNEHYVQTLGELGRRAQGHIVMIAFEQFERVIRRLFAEICFMTRNNSENRLIRRTHEFNRSLSEREIARHARGTPEYFLAYAEWRSKSNCNDLINELATAFPILGDRLLNNSIMMNIPEFLRAIAFCRHRIVHNCFEMEDSELRRFPKCFQELLRRHITTSVLTGKTLFLPTRDFVHYACSRSAGVGLLIYHVISEALNLQNDLSEASLAPHAPHEEG